MYSSLPCLTCNRSDDFTEKSSTTFPWHGLIQGARLVEQIVALDRADVTIEWGFGFLVDGPARERDRSPSLQTTWRLITMPGVSVQFHMLFDELVDFVATMMTRHSLAVELERFFPTKTTLVVTTPSDLSEAITRFGHVDCMFLLCKPPRARKYEHFYLYVGQQKGRKLGQSHLGAGTDKAEAFKTLKKIAYQLKKRTIAGAAFGTFSGELELTGL